MWSLSGGRRKAPTHGRRRRGRPRGAAAVAAAAAPTRARVGLSLRPNTRCGSACHPADDDHDGQPWCTAAAKHTGDDDHGDWAPCVPSAAPGLSYDKSAPCHSPCFQPDKAHGGSPWCATQPHRDPASWLLGVTRRWAPCMSAAAVRRGWGMSKHPRVPCATPCYDGYCKSLSNEEQECLPAVHVLERLAEHMSAMRESGGLLIAQATQAGERVVALHVAAAGKQARRDNLAAALEVTRGLMPVALAQFTELAQALVHSQGLQARARPTGAGVSLIMQLLQRGVDALLAVSDAVRRVYTSPTWAELNGNVLAAQAAAREMAATHEVAMAAEIEHEEMPMTALLGELFTGMPLRLSEFVFSTSGFWTLFLMGAALVVYRLSKGDTDFTHGATVAQAGMQPYTNGAQDASWLVTPGGPMAVPNTDQLRQILFIGCLMATDGKSLLATSLRHVLLYRWLLRWVGVAPPPRDGHVPERGPRRSLMSRLGWAAARGGAYLLLTRLLDNVARWACQFVFWARSAAWAPAAADAAVPLPTPTMELWNEPLQNLPFGMRDWLLAPATSGGASPEQLAVDHFRAIFGAVTINHDSPTFSTLKVDPVVLERVVAKKAEQTQAAYASASETTHEEAVMVTHQAAAPTVSAPLPAAAPQAAAVRVTSDSQQVEAAAAEATSSNVIDLGAPSALAHPPSDTARHMLHLDATPTASAWVRGQHGGDTADLTALARGGGDGAAAPGADTITEAVRGMFTTAHTQTLSIRDALNGMSDTELAAHVVHSAVGDAPPAAARALLQLAKPTAAGQSLGVPVPQELAAWARTHGATSAVERIAALANSERANGLGVMRKVYESAEGAVRKAIAEHAGDATAWDAAASLQRNLWENGLAIDASSQEALASVTAATRDELASRFAQDPAMRHQVVSSLLSVQGPWSANHVLAKLGAMAQQPSSTTLLVDAVQNMDVALVAHEGMLYGMTQHMQPFHRPEAVEEVFNITAGTALQHTQLLDAARQHSQLAWMKSAQTYQEAIRRDPDAVTAAVVRLLSQKDADAATVAQQQEFLTAFIQLHKASLPQLVLPNDDAAQAARHALAAFGTMDAEAQQLVAGQMQRATEVLMQSAEAGGALSTQSDMDLRHWLRLWVDIGDPTITDITLEDFQSTLLEPTFQ